MSTSSLLPAPTRDKIRPRLSASWFAGRAQSGHSRPETSMAQLERGRPLRHARNREIELAQSAPIAMGAPEWPNLAVPAALPWLDRPPADITALVAATPGGFLTC